MEKLGDIMYAVQRFVPDGVETKRILVLPSHEIVLLRSMQSGRLSRFCSTGGTVGPANVSRQLGHLSIGSKM